MCPSATDIFSIKRVSINIVGGMYLIKAASVLEWGKPSSWHSLLLWSFWVTSGLAKNLQIWIPVLIKWQRLESMMGVISWFCSVLGLIRYGRFHQMLWGMKTEKKMAETVDFSIQWEKVRMLNQGRGTGQIYRTSFQMQELMEYILLSSHRRGPCYISTGLCWIGIWKRWTYSRRFFMVLFLMEVRSLYCSCYCPIRELSWNLCNQELWGMPDERKEPGHGL